MGTIGVDGGWTYQLERTAQTRCRGRKAQDLFCKQVERETSLERKARSVLLWAHGFQGLYTGGLFASAPLPGT